MHSPHMVHFNSKTTIKSQCSKTCSQLPSNLGQASSFHFHDGVYHSQHTSIIITMYLLLVSYAKFLGDADDVICIIFVFSIQWIIKKWFLSKWKQERSLPFTHSDIFLESPTTFKQFISHINAWLFLEKTSIMTLSAKKHSIFSCCPPS